MSKLQRLAELIDRLNEDEGLSVASVKSIKHLAKKALAESALVECGACHGSGWVPWDAEIGTEQECFVCGGTGVSDDEPATPKEPS